MGIDVYMGWKNMPEEFDVCRPPVYLRESYHGGPYVTQYLLKEAFYAENGDHGMPLHVQISAKTLRDRLPAAVLIALYKDETVYGSGTTLDVLGVDIADVRISQENDETVYGSGATLDASAVAAVSKLIPNIAALDQDEATEMARHFSHEQLYAAAELIRSRRFGAFVQQFIDFVEFAERKEREIGEPVFIQVDR